ncbi:MAG: hypothetical protein LBC76_10700 [Treponema sp.]|nr:hypothetical protein [Treponema sp.]
MKKSEYNFDNLVSFVRQPTILFHKRFFFFLLIINCFVSVHAERSDAHASDANENDEANRVDPVSAVKLEASVSMADAARKRAVDFESPDYFPSEWDAADSMYVTAANIPKTIGNIQQLAEMFDNAANSYDDIFRKTIPLYAQAREDEIMTVREKLINTGFKKYFPDYLRTADNKALFALSQFETGDFYDARDTAADALNEYEILYTGAKILQIRREIIEHDFVKYDAGNFEKADDAAQTANDEFKAGNNKAALINAEDALRCYDNVLANGLRAVGETRN